MTEALRKFIAGPGDGARLWSATSDGVKLSILWAQRDVVEADSPQAAAEAWACLCSLPDGTRITVTEVATGLEHRLVIEAETTYTAYREPEDHGGGVP